MSRSLLARLSKCADMSAPALADDFTLLLPKLGSTPRGVLRATTHLKRAHVCTLAESGSDGHASAQRGRAWAPGPVLASQGACRPGTALTSPADVYATVGTESCYIIDWRSTEENTYDLLRLSSHPFHAGARRQGVIVQKPSWLVPPHLGPRRVIAGASGVRLSPAFAGWNSVPAATLVSRRDS